MPVIHWQGYVVDNLDSFSVALVGIQRVVKNLTFSVENLDFGNSTGIKYDWSFVEVLVRTVVYIVSRENVLSAGKAGLLRNAAHVSADATYIRVDPCIYDVRNQCYMRRAHSNFKRNLHNIGVCVTDILHIHRVTVSVQQVLAGACLCVAE